MLSGLACASKTEVIHTQEQTIHELDRRCRAAEERASRLQEYTGRFDVSDEMGANAQVGHTSSRSAQEISICSSWMQKDLHSLRETHELTIARVRALEAMLSLQTSTVRETSQSEQTDRCLQMYVELISSPLRDALQMRPLLSCSFCVGGGRSV